ncbi:MAG: OmpA family protein [Thermodesulfobacteriota bacterium]
MSMSLKRLVPLLMVCFLLTFSGCGGKDDDAKVAAPPVDDTAIGKEEPLESKSLGIMEGRTSGPMLPVYFDFDSSSIRSDQVARIQVNADFLNGNKDVDIRIEGNCDPRGSREYNMALGERRALSARKYLINLGVSAGRLSTTSYGAERILLHGHDELSWAQNRRDDFVISK